MNTMTAHFAIIRDNSSRYNRDQICQVEATKPEQDIDPSARTYSRCGKFTHWEAGKLFISEVLTVELTIIEDHEREIDACNLLISALNKQAHERLEYALEPVRARKTELMQIAYQPKSNIPPDEEYAEDLPDPDDSPMDEEFEAIQDRNVLDELIREDMLQPKSDGCHSNEHT